MIWTVQCRGSSQARRRIRVPDSINVEQLHTVLQTAWGVSADDTFVLHDEDHNVSITNDVDLYAHEGMAPLALDYFDDRIHRYWLWAAECQLSETMCPGQRWQYLWSSYEWLCTVEAEHESQPVAGPICLGAASWTIPSPSVFSKQQYQVRSKPEPDCGEINEQLQALHLQVLQRKLPPTCGGAGQQLDPEAWLQFLEQQWDLPWLRPALDRSQWFGIRQLPILRWYARLLDELQRRHPLQLDKGQRLPGMQINRFLREGWSPSQAGWVQEYYAERQRKKQAQHYFRYLLQVAAAAEHAVVAGGEVHLMNQPRPQNDEQWVGLYLCLVYHSATELVPPVDVPIHAPQLLRDLPEDLQVPQQLHLWQRRMEQRWFLDDPDQEPLEQDFLVDDVLRRFLLPLGLAVIRSEPEHPEEHILAGPLLRGCAAMGED